MKWNVARARESFSALIEKAATEPQAIYNRDRLVGAVIGAKAFQEFQELASKKTQRTLAESCRETRQVLAEESYELEIPPRRNRREDFLDAMDRDADDPDA